MLRPKILLISAALILFCAGTAAAENKAKIKKQTPTIKGSTGLFNIPNADTLREGEFSFSLFGSKFNREPGDLAITTFPVSFTLGLHDRVEFFASYEVYKRVHAGAICGSAGQTNMANAVCPPPVNPGDPLRPTRLIFGFPASYYNDTPFMDVGFGEGPGDLTAGFKINLLSERRGGALGVAIQPIAKFSISSDREDLGQGLTSGLSDYGFDFIVSKDSGGATFTGNIGLLFSEDSADLQRRVERQNSITYGVGLDVPLGSDKVYAIGEYVGRFFWGDRTTAFPRPQGGLGAAFANPKSPQDIYGGIRYFPAKWLAISAAYNFYFNTINEDLYRIPATDHHGWFAQVAFQRKINRPPTATCSVERSPIIEGESTTVTATIDDPDDDELTITWKASGGSINPSDSTATFDSTGAAPGTYMVMAEASDGENVASCSVDVQVNKNKKPPTIACEPSSQSVAYNQSVSLTARASDPNGDALTYSWTVDGQSVTNDSPEFEFGAAGRSPGAHSVTVTVTDVDGMSATCTFTVNVQERPQNDPTCSLSLDKTMVFAGDTVNATVTASDPDGDPLTYSWMVDGQPHSGSGASQAISTSGMAGGAHTVTSTVRDDRGGVCTDTKTFSVVEKIIIQMPLDNVGKAQLDEIALKLQQNPNLHAKITGHTDSRGSERANERVGLRRANSARDYLVKEHQIDAGRIETVSAGESQPIADNDTSEGRKQNRRVEVELYVP